MASTFDMVNNALMRQLERLDDIDPSSDEGKQEIARAKAVNETAVAAIENANATVSALKAMSTLTTQPIHMPALLGGVDD